MWFCMKNQPSLNRGCQYDHGMVYRCQLSVTPLSELALPHHLNHSLTARICGIKVLILKSFMIEGFLFTGELSPRSLSL